MTSAPTSRIASLGLGGGVGLDDGLALGAERVEVAPLVLVALAADEVGVEVDAEGLLELAPRDGKLERRQMRAQKNNARRGRGADRE